MLKKGKGKFRFVGMNMERKKQKLTDVCTIQYGYAFDSKKFSDDSENIALIRIRAVKSGVSNTYYTGEYDKSYLVKEGEIIVGMDGEFNIAKWKSDPALLNQRVCKISGKDNIVEDYLQYYLSLELKNIERRTSFVTVKHLSAKELNALTLEIHTYEEQKKIANQLKLTESIIEKRKQQLSDLDNLIKSRFVEMFGDPVSNSMGWNKTTCKKVTSKIGSGATPKGGNESYKEEGISLIRSMNVHNDRFEYKDLAYIDDEQAKKLSNVTIEEYDVLLNITGASVARCCVVPPNILPARVNQHVSILRCTEELIPVFLSQQFTNGNYQKLLWNIATSGGATREAITKQQIEELEIIMPPIDFQIQFAIFVQQVDKLKVEVQKSLEETLIFLDSLMQKYFE